MRWLAAVMIILCSWLSGQCAVDRLRTRKQFLERLSEFVRHMSAQISYALVPPDRIIREHDDGEDGFFGVCIWFMDSGEPVDRAWLKAVGQCTVIRTLREDQRRLLCELGTQLGVYDAGMQLCALERFASELNEFCDEARLELNEKSRLYTTCSLLAGTLLSILII